MTRCRPMLLFFLAIVALSVVHPAQAVYEKADGFPWNLTLHGVHDKPIADALPNGSFFMNVGPTGIRAQITHKHPAWFTVKFVFKNSPAAGKIKPGDIILGANGKIMNVPHQFGRRRVTGWKGPMEGMAVLIEDAQGKEGKLELIVWPGGDKAKQKKVMIEIEPVGLFSDTFPYNCERSDKLMKTLCDFLANEYQRDGKFGRLHASSASILALMASGDNRYSGVVNRAMSGYFNRTYKSNNVGGFPCWSFGYDGIVIGEYYLLTKNRAIVSSAKSLSQAIMESQNPENGGFTHRPYPVIANRVASGGPAGYGPMAATTGLIMLGQSLFKAGGLPYDEQCYERIHQGFLTSWNDNGSIGYGMAKWDRAVLQLKGESKGKAKNKLGIGYRVPTGMEGLTEYDVVWPTPDDKRGAPIGWLKTKEAEKAAVYLVGKDKVLVVRDMSRKGPSRPIGHSGKPISHIVRTGTAALAHGIGNAEKPEWQHMSDLYAVACAVSPNALLDGHASTLMHTLWGSLGAARAGDKPFRYYMQGIKWWFIMAQTHDGSFVAMPGRDYASTDHVYAGRTMPTATAALILAVKERKLQITGADNTQPIPKSDSPKAADKTKKPTGVDLSALGSNFAVKHCTKEAKFFDSEKPYAYVLELLDRAAEKDGDYGLEAAEFGKRIRVWLRDRNSELVMQALGHPAKALSESRDHLRRLSGIDSHGAAELRVLIDAIGDDRNTVMLSRYFDLYNAVLKQETERGNSASTKKRREEIKRQLERFVSKPGVSKSNKAEAAGLLERLSAEPAAEQ